MPAKGALAPCPPRHTSPGAISSSTSHHRDGRIESCLPYLTLAQFFNYLAFMMQKIRTSRALPSGARMHPLAALVLPAGSKWVVSARTGRRGQGARTRRCHSIVEESQHSHRRSAPARVLAYFRRAALAASILLVFGACSGSSSDDVDTASTEANDDVVNTASTEADDDVVDTESAETCDDEEIGDEGIAVCKHPGIDVDDLTNLDDLPTGEGYVVPMELSVPGALEKSLVEDVVQQHLQEVQQCYNQQLQRNPDLAGEVIVEWMLAPSGDVFSASIGESDLDSQSVERCITQRIRRWTFPEPDDAGVARVQYTFDFEVR